MKKPKVLSLLLAFSLLFHTTGIEALATTVSDPAFDGQSVETSDDLFSEDDVEAETSGETSEEGEADQKSSEEAQDPEQSSEAEGEESKESPEETEAPEQPAEEEEVKEPSEETEAEEPVADDVSEDETLDADDAISEDSVSENTISENTLPEEEPEQEAAEEDAFAIFPGLGDNYTLSSAQLADKKVLAAHVGDIVSTYSVKAGEYPDAEGVYELGEVVYLAETEAEAQQIAEAFGGDLDSYSYGVAVIGLPKKATVALAVAAAADPDTKLPAVWPNYYNYLTDDDDMNEINAAAAANDPQLTTQWQHDYIGTGYVWTAGYKGQGVKVAVIDTGLQKSHEDLSANAAAGRNFVGGASGTEYNNDNQTHGTHVAGIIAADDNNGKGGAGIAPDAQVRGYCVFPTSGSAKSADIKRAINAAVEDGNDIINMSVGNPMYDADYAKVIDDAYKKGVAVFASAGNEDTDGNSFPAAYSGAISVGAVDQNSARAAFSNYGSTVKLSFPGVHIYSTVPGGYGYMSGTSQASPAAAGTAAVILSANDSIRSKSGKARVDALLSAMKASTTKCSGSGMGAGTTWLPGVLKIATDMTAPDAPVITINGTPSPKDSSGKTYVAESVTATLSTQTAVGVEIWYATDGKTPAYKNGEVINGTRYKGTAVVLKDAKNVTIKAIALNPVTGKVSKVASKTCVLTPIPTKLELVAKDGVSRIAAGKSLTLSAVVTPDYAISKQVSWSVEGTGITVSAKGVVKTTAATPAGNYKVTATAVGADGVKYDGVPAEYKFQVISGALIKKLAFMEDGKTLKAKPLNTGETFDLKTFLQVTPQDASVNATVSDVVWSSSNSKVAAVDNGVITAVAPGKAVIKAISNDGYNKSASYSVTVNQPVTRITLSGPDKVAVGRGITLKATVEPANATNKKLTWKVEGNDNNVTVSNGKVTAKKGATGTYTVTAQSVGSPNVTSAAYPVTIVSGEITKITLSENKMVLFSKQAVTGTTPTTGSLTATVEGKSGADTSLITWTSSAPAVATVNENNGVVTAKAPGKAVITCAAIDGSNKKATCTVNVTVPMSKLVIGTTDSYGDYFDIGGYDDYVGFIAQGKSIKMSARCSSNYGTPSNKNVTWTSSNSEILTVDKKGKVTAKSTAAVGSQAYITATAADGSGVVSNQYIFIVAPLYKQLSVTQPYSDAFRVEAPTGNGYYASPDYFTVNVSGGKNPGLNKFYDEDEGWLLCPIPGKVTTSKSPYSQLTTKDAVKMTITVKLRDGSGLKAKKTCWAVRFNDGTVRYYK